MFWIWQKSYYYFFYNYLKVALLIVLLLLKISSKYIVHFAFSVIVFRFSKTFLLHMFYHFCLGSFLLLLLTCLIFDQSFSFLPLLYYFLFSRFSNHNLVIFFLQFFFTYFFLLFFLTYFLFCPYFLTIWNDWS